MRHGSGAPPPEHERASTAGGRGRASTAGGHERASTAGGHERASTAGGRGPAAREVERPAPVEGMLERAIAHQVRRHRLADGATLGELARRVGISKAMLSKIENAQTSCSLTTLARLATALDVPATALYRGADTTREAVFTAADAGARITARGTRVGHDYTLLGALRGPHRRMEAHLVTLTERSEVFPLFQHPGTELLYMLEGVMEYGHGDTCYTLRPGDALQLDGEGVHGPHELVELPIRFLSVVAYGDGER